MTEKIPLPDIHGISVDLRAMVTYQDGAVVSRTLLDKTAGTITLFAFASGQGLSEHTAPYDTFVYITDGEATMTIAGKTVNVKTSEAVIMPANQPHAIKAVKPFKMLLVMIKA